MTLGALILYASKPGRRRAAGLPLGHGRVTIISA